MSYSFCELFFLLSPVASVELMILELIDIMVFNDLALRAI